MVTETTPAKPRRRQPGSVLAAVDRLLKGEELDDGGEAKAAIARALARQLDAVTGEFGTGQAAMSTAGIARELREVLDALLETRAEDGAFVARLIDGPAAVGDAA